MADNYLEKKMEALRDGKLQIKKSIPGINPKGKRVLISGGCHGAACEMAMQYRKEGHRVAVFDEDVSVGRELAYRHGVRFHHVSLSDTAAIQSEIRSLLTAWRGIDIIVADNSISSSISEIIWNWKDSLPIADKTPLEIVII